MILIEGKNEKLFYLNLQTAFFEKIFSNASEIALNIANVSLDVFVIALVMLEFCTKRF